MQQITWQGQNKGYIYRYLDMQIVSLTRVSSQVSLQASSPDVPNISPPPSE